MATFDTRTMGNIFDVLKMKLPDGSPVDSIVNSLVEQDDFSRLVPAYPANNSLTHHGLRTISLPTGYFVDVGGSWKSSKAQREPFVEALCTIRSTYEAPVDTFTTEKREVGEALLRAEKSDHVTMMNQTVTNLMLEGTTAPNQSAIVGLMKRAPYMTYDNLFCFSAGDTGSDLRSCWLMKPGVNTLHTLYNPNHPTLGVEQTDKGEQKVTNDDDSTIAAGEHRWDIMIEFMIQKGICVRDMRALKRIANVACGVSDYPGTDLINTIIEASIINAPTKGTMQVNQNGQTVELPSPWLLMCDERLYAKMVVATNDKLKVYTSDKNIYQTELPMIGPDIIVCRMDALNKTIGSGETAVAAAA
jgi:hypothetical protein